jgi:hypothetical protein
MRTLVVVALAGCGATAQQPSTPPQHREPAPIDDSIVRDTIAVDDDHACAIQATGRVACWGRGSAGRLATVPFEVVGLDAAVGVSVGDGSTCAWTANGRVFCWRGDARGSFVPGLDDIVQISVNCALHATGRVSCWPSEGSPRDIAGISDAVELAGMYAGGAMQLCARTKAGVVMCGNSVDKFEPIPELTGATSIAGAGARYAVLLPGHRLATWVGFTGYPMPQFVDDVDAERVIVGGHLNEHNHSVCVIGGHARCWSWSAEPLTLSDAAPPPPGTRDLAMDPEAMCARVGNRVVCSGRIGRLGDGSSEYADRFAAVDGVGPARQLVAIGRTFCALRETGRVVCWGEQPYDSEAHGASSIELRPVELPGVSDAVEIAMEVTGRGDGTPTAMAVCARRPRVTTCWTAHGGKLVAADRAELAGATKLYAGPAVCGMFAGNVIRCVRFGEGSVPGFAEDDYENYVYRNGGKAITRVLAQRLGAALRANKVPDGFENAAAIDANGPTDVTFQPPKPTDVVEQRRIAWEIYDPKRARGAVCVRHRNGTIACWGERDYLGIGQQTTRTDAVPVRGIEMGPRVISKG